MTHVNVVEEGRRRFELNGDFGIAPGKADDTICDLQRQNLLKLLLPWLRMLDAICDLQATGRRPLPGTIPKSLVNSNLRITFFTSCMERGTLSRPMLIVCNCNAHWCLCFNHTSPYQYQCPMASHDININNNENPAVHSLNIIPTNFGNHTVNSFPSTLAQVAKV